jgi:nitronate monooxygenase
MRYYPKGSSTLLDSNCTMSLETRFTQLIGIRYPIIQAPMAGGATTPDLVAAVCNSGGLGSFAAGILSPEGIRPGIAEIRRRTDRPFGVNLFVLDPPNPNPDPAHLAQAMEWLEPFRRELGLPPAAAPTRYCEPFADQVAAVLEARPPVVSFAFGLLDPSRVAEFKAAGSLVVGTATTVAEARAWASVGADAVCAQGVEAGGHRGTFLSDFDGAMIGTLALVPQVADAVKIPVIVAGGIMDGRGIAAALILGAAACQLGTAFLTCPEAGIPPVWKDLLQRTTDDGTQITRVFSGRPARALANDFIKRMRAHEDEVPPYPIQNALTMDIRQAAAQANRPEYLSLYAGQAAGLSRGLPAADLIARLVEETEEVLRQGVRLVNPP